MESQSRSGVVDVDIWKSKLITSRMTLRRMMMEEFKYDLSDRVVPELQREEQREREYWDPQQIPEEVWLIICKYLEVDSMFSMFNTCQLFRTYFEVLVIPVLFKQVLPIMLQRKYLSPNEVLKCRLLSKPMCLMTDKFLESKDSWKPVKAVEPPHLNEDCLPSVKKFISFPVPNEIADHPRNPFVGRAVIADLHSFEQEDPNVVARRRRILQVARMNRHRRGNWVPLRQLAVVGHAPENAEDDGIQANNNLEGDDDSSSESDEPDDDANNEEELEVIPNPLEGRRLETCGKHIWHLLLEARNRINLRPDMIPRSLGQCPNLRTIKIRGRIYIIPSDLDGIQRAVENLHLPHLTSLSVDVDDFQHILIRKFSGQLEELQIEGVWKEKYYTLDWSNLKILKVGKIDSLIALRSLYRLKAGKLRKLLLHLSGPSCGESLQLLLQTIHHFSQLEELILDCDWNWKISEKEVLALNPLSFPDICSTSLKRLELRTGFCDKITYSFLLYFAVLENLHISYGRPGLDYLEDFDNPVWIGNTVKQLINKEMYRKTEEARSNELIELREYIYVNKEKINKSVIWNMLPFLKKIEITGFWRSCGSTFSKTEKFVRNV